MNVGEGVHIKDNNLFVPGSGGGLGGHGWWVGRG